MKQYWDMKYLKIALYAILVTIVAILTYRISSNTDNILPDIYGFIQNMISIFSPIIYGLLIAYLMNPVMGFFEHHLIRWSKSHTPIQFKYIRIISIVIVYVCFFGTLLLTVKFLIPQILENIKVLGNNLPSYIKELNNYLASMQVALAENLAFPGASNIINEFFSSFNITQMFDPNAITDILSHLLDTIIASAVSLTGTLLNWVIGFVIALYALMQKETFINGSKRITYALFKENTANKLLGISSESHNMITKFFVGKSLDSLIIGILCFIGLSILQNPYALLLALIVGVCNMIPYFGPFIGAIPAVILTLFQGFAPAVAVALFILALQQFDGLFLGPKILGNSIGITPFWIISAITIGGALAGPIGMFFASPILAVILNASNRWVDKKLIDKSITLPKLEPDAIIPISHPPHSHSSSTKKHKKNKK